MPLPGQSSGTEAEEPHIQYAALPWRMPGKRLEILLLTSRDTGRWVIPKGWPKKGLKPWETAAEEAYEEGGIHGVIEQAALGWYDYRKRMGDKDDLDCRVEVFPLQVRSESYTFPESGQRQRKWFDARRAAALVDEPDLRRLMTKFIRKHAFRRAYRRLLPIKPTK